MSLKSHRKKVIGKVLFFVVTIILIYNGYTIGVYIWSSHNNTKLNKELSATYSVAKIVSKDEDILERFQPLLKINKDVIGWLKVPNTLVNYPVVKTENNDFYLHNNIEKEESTSGTIFMDFRNKGNGKDRNIIIYGHNMKDGSMFKGLMQYKNEEFIKDNSIIEFSTLNSENHWEIFSVYITDTQFNYIRTEFTNDEEYGEFLKEIKNKSLFNTGVTVSKDDQILTLSTCSYEFNNARLAVHAKMIKQ